MGCATGIIRLIVFLFNFACAAVAIALIAIGSVIIANVGQFDTDKLPVSEFLIAPGLILGLGILIFLIAFFGCCGACRNNSCMLKTYAIILIALFIAQLAIGIYGYVKIKDMNGDKIDEGIEKELQKGIQKLIDEYKTHPDPKNPALETLDLLQSQLKCCGDMSYTDYAPVSVPWSCCSDADISNKKCNTPNKYYETGCTKTLINDIKDYLEILGIVAMSICAIELVGAIFALCLAAHAKR